MRITLLIVISTDKSPEGTLHVSCPAVVVNATILPKALSITAPSIASKVYDGTNTAAAVTVGTLSGFINTETVTATATAAAYYKLHKDAQIGLSVLYRQDSMTGMSSTTGMVTYTMGM